MHYYQFNIGDYASHTRHLSLIEDIAYRRLLDAYYLHECPLNVGVATVARLIGMREHELEIAAVLSEFFELTDDGWIHSRADKEIEHYHSKIQQASRAGKASAERRINASSTDVQPTNNQEPITNNHKPDIKSNRGSRLPVDFVLPEDWIQFCKTERKDLNPDKVFAEFKDYWTALPAGKGTKADWTATWRNWVRRQSAPKQTFAQQAADIARMTVPSTAPDRDPVLVQLEQDFKKATPMPANIREMMQGVVKRI